jgi:acyl-CoA thioesterase
VIGETDQTADGMSGQPTWRFDRHTQLTNPTPGVHRAELDPALRGFGGIHGGYQAAVALRAMTEAINNPAHTLRTLALTFLASCSDGPLDLLPAVERAGRTVTGASVRLQQDTTIGFGMATFGADRPGLARLDRSMPDVPPPEQCAPLGAEPVPGSDGLLIEHRPAAPPLPFAGSGQARIAVWMRLGEDRPLDALSAIVLADGAVPAFYGALDTFVPMPTIDLTIQIAALAAHTQTPAWVLGIFTNVHAATGYAVEDAELWSPNGHLVLTGRQTRRVSLPQADRNTPPGT